MKWRPTSRIFMAYRKPCEHQGCKGLNPCLLHTHLQFTLPTFTQRPTDRPSKPVPGSQRWTKYLVKIQYFISIRSSNGLDFQLQKRCESIWRNNRTKMQKKLDFYCCQNLSDHFLIVESFWQRYKANFFSSFRGCNSPGNPSSWNGAQNTVF